MNISIFTLCGCAVIACVLIITVRQHRPDIAIVLTAAAGVVMFVYISSDLREAVEQISSLTDSLDGFDQAIGTVIRALGICLTAQLGADICRDSGMASAASRVELGGRVAVLLMIMPLLADVLDICAQIISLPS